MNRLTSLADSRDRLRRELREVHHALQELAKQLVSVELQTQQLIALRMGDRDAADRMDGLEQVLDLNHLATHLRDAVRRADLIEAPVPHALITDVLPLDMYEAAIDAIPSRIFFTPRDGEQELPVPPTLAPLHSIATWMFLADAVKQVFVPMFIERFEEPVDRHLRALGPSIQELNEAGGRFVARGRIVLRQPGDVGRPGDGGPWEWLTLVLDLARAEDSEEFGSMLRTSAAARALPFCANTALVLFHSSAHEFVSIPATAPVATERYACEFRIGPDKKTRRILQQ